MKNEKSRKSSNLKQAKQSTISGEGKQPINSKVPQWKTFAFWLSLLAIFISIVPVWDTIFRSELDVLLGKQIRFHVSKVGDDNSTTEPIIFLSISCYNSGGKTAVLHDTKLIVKFKSLGKNILIREFESFREIANFIMVDGATEQFPVLPMVVPGKSTTMKQYIYYPSKSMHNVELPVSFDLEIDLFVIEYKKWQHKGIFNVKGLNNLWQDLKSGPPYNNNTYTISSIEILD